MKFSLREKEKLFRISQKLKKKMCSFEVEKFFGSFKMIENSKFEIIFEEQNYKKNNLTNIIIQSFVTIHSMISDRIWRTISAEWAKQSLWALRIFTFFGYSLLFFWIFRCPLPVFHSLLHIGFTAFIKVPIFCTEFRLLNSTINSTY